MAKQSKLQKEYQKELKNLKRRIRYAYKEKGLYFEELPIPDTPEKIKKKDIDELKNLRGEKLWELAEEENSTYDEDEYDYADYEEDDEFEDNVLKGVEERIEAFSPYDFPTMFTGLWHEKNKEYIEGLLDMAIADEGRKNVAKRLEYEGGFYINELVDIILRDSDGDKVEKAIQEFSEIIYSGAMHPITEYGY